jgi:hypothetical protein
MATKKKPVEKTDDTTEPTEGETAPVETVKLVRKEPAFPGGPTEMDSHPDEVANNLLIGWTIAEPEK